MKTDVRTLVVVDMHGYFRAGLQLLAGGQFVALHIRPDYVIRLADGQALSELAGVIGIKLPADFVVLVSGPSDLHLDPVERVPVGVPNRSVDQSVRLRLLADPNLCARWGKQGHQEHDRRSHYDHAAEYPGMCGTLQESSSSSSSSAASSSSSSSSISSSPTTFSSTGFTVTTSKSVPHSGQETTAPSSTSSSSMSRSVSHSGQYTMLASTFRIPLLYLVSSRGKRQVGYRENYVSLKEALKRHLGARWVVAGAVALSFGCCAVLCA